MSGSTGAETPAVAASLRSELKALLVARLRLQHVDPASIADDDPLVGGALALDSIDMLELALAVEEKYGVKVTDAERAQAAFRTIAALAGFVAAHGRGPTGPGAAG
jgi:acyl carrier protein